MSKQVATLKNITVLVVSAVLFVKQRQNQKHAWIYGEFQINPLKTKRRLLYLKTQFVPRSKHFSSRL